MVSYRYLGSALTNANGVASFDYEGTGAGEIDVLASLDNPVSSGSIVSGTFSVFDCYRHDDGTISSHNDIWTGITNTDLTREAEYTTIKEKTVGTTAILTVTGIPLKNYRIECDVYQVDGTQDEWFITVLKQDYTAITSADAKLGEWKHISLDLTNIAPNSRVRLNTGGSCTELRFKNFMLYPYGDNDVISINASNPVIQSTETTNITGSLFLEGELQKNTNIDVYKNGTKVDTISTGSSGVASYTYTGSGAGATEFQFKYGSILSETYRIEDCKYLDTFSTDTSNKYFLGGGSISVGDGVLTYTGSSTDANNYLNIKNAVTPAISNFQGRDAYFKAELSNLPTGVTAQIRIYQTVNGSTNSTYTEYSTDGTASHNRSIDANATSVVFRVQFVGLGENTVTIDNFRVY